MPSRFKKRVATAGRRARGPAEGRGGRRFEFDPSVITRLRERLGLTPTALGRQLEPGMSGAQILDIERRRRGVTVGSLLRLCNRFGLEPCELFRSK
jgi:hypothetical protein